jgi:hypothetical protein
MNRKLFRIGIGLQWLALPVTVIRYWMVWDQLPARIATHFNAAGQPNGWMTREASLTFGLVLTAFLLTVFTAILYGMQRKSSAETASWAFLAFSYLMVGFIYYANASILNFNLQGRPVAVGPFLLVAPLAVIAFMAIYLGSKRGRPLPPQNWIAQEVHGSKLWAAVFLIPLVIELGVMQAIPLASVRLGFGLLAVLFVVFATQAWTGFQYRFAGSGVEISTLGFRLRSIPCEQITEYRQKNWNPMGGYGIRGVGSKRAYVWGNNGVLIKTSDGEVFLGHSDPGRIIRDLDAIKQCAHS